MLTGLATAPQIKTANTAADAMKTDREIILIKKNSIKLINGSNTIWFAMWPLQK